MAHKIRFAEPPDVGSVGLTEQIIQKRAYQLFELRGCQHGHDVDDWLAAEAEVLGRKTAATGHEKADHLKVPSAA